jgi:hypothetical protein
MHGVTIERVNFVRKIYEEVNLISMAQTGRPLGDVYVNGWEGPDAFSCDGSADKLISMVASVMVAMGMDRKAAASEACSTMRNLAEVTGIRRHGMHEFALSADQAIGMGMMKFKMKTSDFVMPVDHMYVVIPRKLFSAEEFSGMFDSFVDNLRPPDEGWDSKGVVGDAVVKVREELHAQINSFRSSPRDVPVVLTKNGNCLMVNAICAGVQMHVVFNETQMMEDTIQRATTLSEMDKMLIRIGLSAALFATMRPSDLMPMELTPKQKRERETIIGKVCKTVVHPSYMIFQPNMKTYRNSTPTGKTRESPEIRNVRPIFVHGHWRNQAYGQKWSLRRLRFMAPQIRYRHAFLGGPENIICSSKL